MSDIYQMDLDDEIAVDDNHRILRVPGGWIYYYERRCSGGEWSSSSVFVPYDNEFDKR